MNERDKYVLMASFVVISLVGGSGIYWFWLGHGIPLAAVTRTGCFVALMAVLHWGAFRCYHCQPARLSASGSSTPSSAASALNTSESSLFSPLASEYGPAMKRAVKQYVIILILGALMLDGGQFARACCVGILGHCLAMTLIAVRRPLTPTMIDLAVLRWGFLPLTPLIDNLAPVFQRWLGTDR